jgi:hypothetical protein
MVNEAPAVDETEIIAADPSLLHLPVEEIDIYIEKLKTRQLFKFMKILTSGAGPLIADLDFNADTDTEQLGKDIISLLLVSLGESDDEILDFLKSMVKPVGLVEPERSKADRERNVEAYTELYTKLDNPEIGDTVAIFTRIVQNELPNLVTLGKQIAALLPSAAKQTTSSKPRSKKSTPAAS